MAEPTTIAVSRTPGDPWITVEANDVPAIVKVQGHEQDGRFVVTMLLVEQAEGLSPHTLRGISIQGIEAVLNPHLSAVQVPSAERVRLRAPTGRNYPDDFYRQVAVAYLQALGDRLPPAPTLAAAAGVPTTTVHRWVKEARRRQLLPPARKGKAG